MSQWVYQDKMNFDEEPQCQLAQHLLRASTPAVKNKDLWFIIFYTTVGLFSFLACMLYRTVFTQFRPCL